MTWDPQVRTKTPGALVGAWGWPGLSLREPLNGPRVGEVPSPSSRTLQPRQDQPHISSVCLHLSKVAPAEMDGGGGVQNGGHGQPAFTAFRNV